jgi:uncharacterized protein (DUF433 family)
MQLESYFEFLPDSRIKLKGTRVYLEDVIERYFEGESPEEVTSHFPSVSVEQAYATILYYLANRPKMDIYILTKLINCGFQTRCAKYFCQPPKPVILNVALQGGVKNLTKPVRFSMMQAEY